ncbi:P-loop NTPase family protein [Arthrobacter sp. R4-81]
MEEESGPIDLDYKMVQTLSRIIGRDYEYVQWYSLEFEPNEEYRDSFQWPGGQILVPHFKVKHRGIEYSSLDMGLGEFSVHLLFWVFEIYRDAEDLHVLLDEPDAFLPPVTAERLASRLIQTANSRSWTLTIATHSEAIIELACENDSFVLLRSSEDGIEAYASQDYGVEIAAELLPPRGVSAVLFCEDESAAALTRAILHTHRSWLAASTAVIWKDGDGYLRMLARHLPRYKGMSISFGLIFDGDQRGKVEDAETATGWPSLFLPSGISPDALFRSLSLYPSALASSLGVESHKINIALDALQGADDHDWVNGICDRFGARTFVLDALADLWVIKNSQDTADFLEELQTRLGV